MGSAPFDAAKPRPVALPDTLAVAEMLLQVVALRPALLSRTDRLVALGKVRVFRAKPAPAVLAVVLRRVWALAEPAA